ncbi:MAG TPA: hypothetical protein VL574_13535 [Stellaceae bacterium]|nr:hypothetical protein [Stellaceae bacterium]
MSFISTHKLISDRISMRSWILYIADIYFVIVLVINFFLLKALGDFSVNQDQVRMVPGIFSFVGALGIYGFRISTYIAIARKFQMPQRAEWFSLLGGLAFMTFFFVFGGWMMEAWVSHHGYKYCFKANEGKQGLYVRDNLTCPQSHISN